MQAAVESWLTGWSRGDVIAALGVFFSVAAVVSALWGWTLRAWLTERRLVKKFGADLYLPEDIVNATRYYVRPDATSIDLAQEMEEGSNVVATRENLFKAIERFIDEESEHRHLLLLADSGMGKSSFVLNYYDYNRRKWWKRYKLAVIPLGHTKALEKIGGIRDSNETILFLDAFDEDPEARKGYEARLDALMRASSEFRRVLITCRTQFFPKDAAIPKVTSWVFAPRTGQAQHTFWRLYLAPFSEKQVATFLRRRFWFWSFGKKKKARELAKKVPKLTVRPMLLTHIPDFIHTEMEVTTTWNLYEVMTEKWYEREQGFWKRHEDLKAFSEEVAVQFYLRFLRQGSDRVSREDIAEVLTNMQSSAGDIDEWNATSRSLLHRDAGGNWKFAHRSIMEFLFLKKFFAGDERCRGVAWTDQMKNFVVERRGAGKPTTLVSFGSLNGADLSEMDLRGADLRGAQLGGANFRGTNFSGADLRGADLSGVDLSGANLRDTDLSGVDLSGVNLSGVDLSEVNLSGVDLRGRNLAGAHLRGARLISATLSEANLNEADLGMADLSLANLREANLSGANLRGATLETAFLMAADLSGADLSGADLNWAYLSGANLESANLNGADLVEAVSLTWDALSKATIDANTKLAPEFDERLRRR